MQSTSLGGGPFSLAEVCSFLGFLAVDFFFEGFRSGDWLWSDVESGSGLGERNSRGLWKSGSYGYVSVRLSVIF